MSEADAEAARGLILKAEHDWETVRVGLKHGAPLDTVCFHIQQTAEKLLKGLLASAATGYPFTHDLRNLMVLAVERFPSLELFRTVLPRFSVYAVAMRYDAAMEPTREETLGAYETVKRLRTMVYDLLPPEVRPGDVSGPPPNQAAED